MKKKNARQPEQTSANKQRHFAGTDNPRHLRVLHALMRRPMPREEVDRVAGCSNGPDLIFDLRDKGLEIPCVKVACVDRDGLAVERGIYSPSETDRRKIARWLAKRGKGAA
ncbi:hypothetical protein WI84_13870 [Burkholderia ubonensis]|uniref:hypothetical protein n=1 Tax=Burkholderia ubonensis TaxID=101571 RepID=UPI00075DA1D4|nr:hypothetical protein [Burkholderia ubonensis]KVD37564.1 hypothetical protein WI84_13870 [Burkholderia ubonensis]KVD66698.1 hypothetical protein WI87_30630 [Burkholderia ubonensis]